jgi:hypothetical protein
MITKKDTDPQNWLADELADGEEVLWTGRPPPQYLIWRQCRQEIAFAIVGIAAAIFIVALYLSTPSSQTPSGPVCISGIALLFLSTTLGLFNAYRTATKTIYAITPSRAMIIKPVLGKRVMTISKPKIARIERRNLANGAGDLLFLTEPMGDSIVTQRSQKSGFFGVPNVHEVERLLIETLGGKGEDTP